MAILARRTVEHRSLLVSRQIDGPPPSSTGLSTGQITSIIVIASLFVLISFVSIVVSMRRKKLQNSQASSKSKSTSIFSRFRSGSNRGQYSSHLQPSSQANDGDSLAQTQSADTRRDVEMELVNEGGNPSRNANTTTTTNATNNNDSTVDRHTSVRSIMTLPAYTVSARPTEQVLGREGERAGIDLVLEQPETQEEEEDRREEEMSSLYQIRQARREEAAEREERRRLRREARQRGDTAALNRMQRESRQRAQQQTEGVTLSAQLIAEHQSRPRERRVSSVQYQDIGVARHDGSRIRNTSIDSDNRPLLSSAASISGTASASRPESLQLHQHGRDRSTTSFQSISSMESNSTEDAMTGSRIGQDFEVISLDTGRTRSHSSAATPAVSSAPSGNEESAPVEPPPNYEDAHWGEAPPYESPVSQMIPQLPRISPIPSIRVSPTMSPIPSPRP